jgi:predicted TPR repeat methyltransferase
MTSEPDVHLPDLDGADQDAEWAEIELPEGRFRVRFHDYAEIYSVPGLYEKLFYDVLECCSPQVVRELLEAHVGERALVVLDVGAGNGMVGEQLAKLGAERIVGIDILPEAAEAAARDRPGVYDDYKVIDLTDPPHADDAELAQTPFTCLTCVAALGFDDIPPEAFERAFGYLQPGGLTAFTLKERFAEPRDDESGFSRLLRDLQASGQMETLVEHRYRHRLSVDGEPLHYVAYVARKA